MAPEVPTGAGPKRHRITLQTMTTAKDEYAQDVPTWSDTATYWAEVRQGPGRMAENADQQKAERTGALVMRYFGPIDQATQRFRFGTRILNIAGVEDVGERHREYRITYQELIGAAAQ